jgi:hypothetical protein
MPIYTLKNKSTGEIFEKNLSISSYEQFLNENPDIERYYSSVPSFGDSIRLGIRKPDASFEKHVIGRMKEKLKGQNHTLDSKKFNVSKEF